METPNIIKELVTKYLDGRKDAVWQHKQSGQWLIKHRDLEIVAAKAGIAFLPPQVLESDSAKCVAMVVTGKLEDRTEWSIGEASPKNTQQAYPYAMAEKRAKDRVILKLMQVHGHIYSEDELPDEALVQSAKPSGPTAAQKAARERAEQKMSELRTMLSLLDSFQQAEYLRNNPQQVAALRWMRDNMPDLYSEIAGLGVEID